MQATFPVDTEYQAATNGVALFDLSAYGKIELTGRDARSFLHNLCTQDVKNLPIGSGCEAFLTTNKARVIAHLWVGHHQTDEGSALWLDMVPGQSEKVLQHLNHYLISEQVELADRTRELGLLRIIGPQANDRFALIAGQALSTLSPWHHHRVPGVGTLRRQNVLGLDGFDLFCPTADVAAIRQRLIENGAVPCESNTYQVLRIEAGLPEYGSDIDENRLAMEVGRTAQAISYAKGCYLGQETIVMARDRGQQNRSLMGVKVQEGSTLLVTGTKLFRATEEVGHITSSVHSPRLGHIIALAYLRRGHWEPGTELVVEPASDGRIASVCALPFS